MRSYHQFCGLARALDHVGHRWTLLIVRELLLGPKRFTDLREGLPGIANNLLADRLRQLQDDGLVIQQTLPPPAANTVYELTDAGHALREAIEALIRWGGRWMTSGPDDDTFRPGWLLLALDALGVGARAEDGTTIDLVVGGEPLRIEVHDGRLTPRRRPAKRADLTVKGEASVILGIAAGAVPPDDALATLTLQPVDAHTATTFTRIFSPGSRSAPAH
ncbi:winged helix-turn-helix transcriptional regulator [soil metagenome]